MSRVAVALMFWGLWLPLLALGCGSGDVVDGADGSCEPGSVRACPCVDGEVGQQSCLEDGLSYDECTACQVDSNAVGGTVEPATGGGVSSGLQNGATGGAETSPVTEDGETLTLGVAPEGAAAGVSCGVGLPVLCELRVERCCIRSLTTDSCIPVDQVCSCDGLDGCVVATADCDGPEDCGAGQQCCGALSNVTGTYSRFGCQTSCDPLRNERVACHEGQDACPEGTVCANSQLLTNVQVCIDPETIRQ